MPLGERRRPPRTSRQLIATSVDIQNHANCNVNSELPIDIWLKLRENPCFFFISDDQSIKNSDDQSNILPRPSFFPPLIFFFWLLFYRALDTI